MEIPNASVIYSGLMLLLDPHTLGWLVLGLSAGFIVGAIPGFNDTNFLAMILPFTIYLGAMQAVIFMMACFCGSQAAGSIPAILLNIPGTPSNAPTCLEGFPLTRKGFAGQALGCSFISSAIGGFITGCITLVLCPIVGIYALQFGPAELFMAAVFGMTAVGSLTGKSVLKGLFSSVLGLFVACVGTEAEYAYSRGVFGFFELYEGFPLIPVLLGLFGYSELFSLVQEDFLIEKGRKVSTGFGNLIEGMKQGLSYWGCMIRSSLIGFIVGIIPGTGGAIATWVSYGQAKQWSKQPQKFGTGHYEGLVSTDACNNGVPGGAIIPTLILGIPGSGTTLIVMAALMINGVRPGPTMFVDFAKEGYAILFSLPLANIVMLIVSLIVGTLFVRVTMVPTKFLVPIIGLFCLAGGFAWRTMTFDMSLVVIFGVFGALLSRYGYSVPAFLLSMLLGPLAETNFHWAVTIGGIHSFLRPIPIVTLLLTVGVLVLPLFSRKAVREAKKN